MSLVISLFERCAEFAGMFGKMRRDKIYAFGLICILCWLGMTYVLFTHQPPIFDNKFSRTYSRKFDHGSFTKLSNNIDRFSVRLKQQIKDSDQLLNDLKEVVESRKSQVIKDATTPEIVTEKPTVAVENAVIPILMFACNRVSVTKAIDPLLKYRGDDPARKAKFPIIVSQDCGHAETANKIRSYGDDIIFIQQPDQSEPQVPKAEKKFKGYFKIARHYGWALNQTFINHKYDQVIIVEDDLEVSPDFFEYFESTLPLLRKDPSLWCVSAWNDNGKKGLIDESNPDLLYRTDFFGGLGWMMTKELWMNELMQKWPRSYWDDWMRQPAQRKNRACIRPEISRTKTFGKIGVSNGLFFDKHLKYIVLNDNPVPFLQKNLDYLIKENYDKQMKKVIANSELVPLQNLKSYAVEHGSSDSVDKSIKVIYKTKNEFKAAVKVLGIMDDFKSGVPRMAYNGVVSTFYKGLRVYLWPGLNWKNYNPTW